MLCWKIFRQKLSLKKAQLKPPQIQNPIAAAKEELRNIRLLHHHTNWFSSPSWANGTQLVPNTTILQLPLRPGLSSLAQRGQAGQGRGVGALVVVGCDWETDQSTSCNWHWHPRFQSYLRDNLCRKWKNFLSASDLSRDSPLWVNHLLKLKPFDWISLLGTSIKDVPFFGWVGYVKENRT